MNKDPIAIAILAALLDSTEPFKPNLLHTTVELEIEARAKVAVDRALKIMEVAEEAAVRHGKRGES